MADKKYRLRLSLSDGTTADAGTFVVPQGEQGPEGKSTYKLAQEAGYTGTEAELAEKLAMEVATDDEFLSEMIAIGALPAASSEGAIITDTDGSIILW